MTYFLQPCSQENLNHVLPEAKKLPGRGGHTKPACLLYSFLNSLLLMTSRHNPVCILLRTWYIPQQQLHPACQIISHVAKLRIYKQDMKSKKKTQRRYLYWQCNLKYKNYHIKTRRLFNFSDVKIAHLKVQETLPVVLY